MRLILTLWRQLNVGATTMALADSCSAVGVLTAADLSKIRQLAYIIGSSGYRRYRTLA